MSSGKEKTGSVKQPMVNPNLVKILEAADQLSGQLNRNRVLFEKVIQKAQAVKVSPYPFPVFSGATRRCEYFEMDHFSFFFFQCGVLAAGLCADLGFNWEKKRRFLCPGLLFSFFWTSVLCRLDSME